MLDRALHRRAILRLLKDYPVVALLGARQVGKTTLALDILQRQRGHRFDLEDSADQARLKDARLALAGLDGLVVIDEVQRRPDLFQTLRVLADRRPLKTRFLVLGSASPDLLRQSSESLAGRIAFHTLDGFDLGEVGSEDLDRLWLRGGFPSSFLARSEDASFAWRRNFVQTFIERDLPQLGVRIPAPTLSRFWGMLAHYHAQIWNASEFARSFGVTDKTVRHYLDLLASAFVVQVLPPWHANLGKRQVKSPKVYIRDTGLLHALLDIRDRRGLERHPKVGASWEAFALRQITQRLGALPQECYFWSVHSGAEIDLLWIRGRRRWGFEFKRTSSPALSRSLMSAVDQLKLQRAFVVHAGDATFPLHKQITALAIARMLDDLSEP